MKKKGFSLIEILLVLAISIISISAMFFLYQSVSSSEKVNTARFEIKTMKHGIEDLYNVTNNYSGLSNELGISANIFPADMFEDDSGPYNIFGGDVRLSIRGGYNNTMYEIFYAGVPARSCANTIFSVINDFKIIEVSGNNIKDFDSDDTDDHHIMTKEEIIMLCDEVGKSTGGNVYLIMNN